MALLAGTAYDPAVAVTKSTAALLAMTALDTTNLRLTFTAPANGTVLVRMRGVFHGSSVSPMALFGVLDGATVKGRAPANAGKASAANTAKQVRESVFLVTGLTPSASSTWDAAYGIEVVSATNGLKYGGPNNTTANDAFGAFSFEIWETTHLLAGVLYDPAVAVSKSTATLLAMTALDTTNLRLVFIAPASGKVLVRLRGVISGATGTNATIHLGVLDGATVKARGAGGGSQIQLGVAAASDHFVQDAELLVTGLTPGASTTWDAAYAVEDILAASNLKYGGPNDTTTDNAWGGFAYEIWEA